MAYEPLEGTEDLLLGVDDDSALLQGLGAISPDAKKAARKYAAVKVKQNMKNGILTREQKYLLANIDQLDSNSRKAVQENKLVLGEFDYYVRKKITGSMVILNSGTVMKPGYSSWDNGRLPELLNAVISKMRIGYHNSVATDESQVIYTTVGAMAPAFVNGDIIVKLGEKTIIDVPIRRFVVPVASAVPNQDPDKEWVDLSALRLIPSNKQVIIEYRQAEGGTLAANNTFIEVSLKGVATRER